jgi:hypothetical protein
VRLLIHKSGSVLAVGGGGGGGVVRVAVSSADDGFIISEVRVGGYGVVDWHGVAGANKVDDVTTHDGDDALDAAANFMMKKQHLMEICGCKVPHAHAAANIPAHQDGGVSHHKPAKTVTCHDARRGSRALTIR